LRRELANIGIRGMLLSASLAGAADIGTVDSFQGQEKDVVILDLVRANPERNIGFTLHPNRLNVALSRAREKLIIVTNLSTFQGYDHFDRVIEIVRSLPNTTIERVTAEQIGISLPEYRSRMEILIKPAMVDVIDESEEPMPSEPISPVGDYVDIY